MAPRIKVAAVGLGWVALHRHLPVMDNGKVVGMVSIRDVAGAMAD